MMAVSASVLMMIARWKSPFAAGVAVSIATFPPPPDWPKTRAPLSRLAAERVDVVAHPFERSHEIQDPKIARPREPLTDARKSS